MPYTTTPPSKSTPVSLLLFAEIFINKFIFFKGEAKKNTEPPVCAAMAQEIYSCFDNSPNDPLCRAKIAGGSISDCCGHLFALGIFISCS
jgi:hypothetical protein